jgi:alkanesulfonate monooxygenase SsuD/methylene tetrahydromethanopterin reductase-like flavin-dependent oxidoreductase (luciferase family)
VTISPKPKQSPLPLWIGGSSEAAIERTARYGTGWLAGSAQAPDQLSNVIGAIRERSASLGRPIDEDHYGAGFGFRLGSWDEPIVQRNVQALTARIGKDANPRAFIAVGGPDAVIDMCARLRSAGVSKFVLRPIATSDDDIIEQSRRIADEVIPTVHAMQ